MCRILATPFAAVVLVGTLSAAAQSTPAPAPRESTPALAPTTQPTGPLAPNPVDTPWARTVQALARALTDGDRKAVDGLLATRAAVRRFDASKNEDATRILDRLSKGVLVGHHGYLHPPATMAADISADFKVTACIPDRAKLKFFLEEEDAETRRANATAAQWVVEQLGASQGTPVGVIVVWAVARPDPRDADAPAAWQAAPAAQAAVLHEPVFILCRGEEVGPNEYKLTNVVYGNPLPD